MQKTTPLFRWIAPLVGFCLIATVAFAQEEDNGGRRRRGADRGADSAQGDRPQRGPGGPGGGRFGFGGPGGGNMGAMIRRMNPIFAALDKDEDGEISSSEIENAIAALKTLDKNTDGKITSDEVTPQFGRSGPGGGFGGPRDPAQMVEGIMRRDENGDGKLTQDELGRMARMLQSADKNNDEIIDKDELTAWAKEAAERGPGGRGARGQGGPGGRGARGGDRGGRGGGGDSGDAQPRRRQRPE